MFNNKYYKYNLLKIKNNKMIGGYNKIEINFIALSREVIKTVFSGRY